MTAPDLLPDRRAARRVPPLAALGETEPLRPAPQLRHRTPHAATRPTPAQPTSDHRTPWRFGKDGPVVPPAATFATFVCTTCPMTAATTSPSSTFGPGTERQDRPPAGLWPTSAAPGTPQRRLVLPPAHRPRPPARAPARAWPPSTPPPAARHAHAPHTMTR